MNQDQPSWIGHTLHERYKIESLLGSGGMATVYKSFDPHLGRHVAIKLIHPHLAQQPAFVRRFKREAAAVAKLHHPHIVFVYDFNDDQGIYYMVLAYLTGGSLKRRLEILRKAGRHLPLSETIDFMVKICEAVDYAHKQDLIHRDIKPDNVLFDQNGEPYLTDFGIARLAADQQTMTVVGTPAYMSPEQIRGDQQLDQRTDIYSLGIMLYEMAGGRPPFEGGMGTLMLKHMQEPVPDIRLLNSTIPETLVAVIEKALQKDSADRWRSAAEMATALRSRKVETRPTVRINAAPTVSVNPTPPPAPRPLPSTEQKRPIWLWALPVVLIVLAIVIGGFLFSGGGSGETETVTPNTTSEPAAGDEGNVVPVAEVATGSCPAGTVLIADGDSCLQVHEVSNAAYQECVGARTCSEPDQKSSLTRRDEEGYYGNSAYGDYPVIRVTWDQANTYCEFVQKRLPTAAEWDQAANYSWPSQDNITQYEDTQAVASTGDVSPDGVHNLADNVSEWVADADERIVSEKVIKGQSFYSQPSDLNRRLPSKPDWGIGFRCAANSQ